MVTINYGHSYDLQIDLTLTLTFIFFEFSMQKINSLINNVSSHLLFWFQDLKKNKKID